MLYIKLNEIYLKNRKYIFAGIYYLKLSSICYTDSTIKNMLWCKMKTDTKVSQNGPNLRAPKHANDWICLMISYSFKGEGPYTVENKEITFFFSRA